ncbi:MAG: undecaprenyl-diphosphate phosphatase [Patescibacteria group bacterium]|nr:undecaprenyl-diphosphate phosphatase [Actinomycetota bacterium]MCL5438500.1 undecaprenyl-diphosphate phosphatase [Patescibacteria group bacterium]
MSLFHAIILAIVEGVTEFLPISSTGHMVLAAALLKVQETEFVKNYEIIIQLGAIFSIVFLYWKKVLQSKIIWKQLLVAFIPAAVIGLVFFKVIKGFLIGNEYVTLSALFIGGILLIALELVYKEKDHHVDNVEKISLKTAFFIGVFQAISVIPGVSRAAATIAGGLIFGVKRKQAVEFSFLLAVPTMFAATALDLVKSNFSFTPNEILILVIGSVVSFLVAIAAVKFLLYFIQNHTFIPFAIYRILLAIIFWLIVLK